ncbi:penicillin amidase [Ureibacillus xyleni]|uniref:Penicillin amidase n=1 Tax=Ureibacillus xyleni TaxID=614648 RepID=A0A285SNU1_9BACL|nr:penicillin acylase family protein [Ureibacillus xyleni]SOC09484.1 penicillin amidase [Ureibacillus xyleni]
MKKNAVFVLLLSLMLVFTTFPPSYAAENENSVVTIHRDEYGVPHIYANSTEELYKAYGYVMAQDRLFQLEMFKRANEGTLSAVFGEQYLKRDETMRRDGYNDEEVQKMIDKMDPFARNILKTFASGIDSYVVEAMNNPGDKLSKDFKDYGLEPERWSAVDVLRLYMASMTAFMDQETEMTNAQMLANLTTQFGEEKAQQIFNDYIWDNDPDSPTSINSEATLGTFTPFGSNTTSDAVVKAAEELNEDRIAFQQQTEELGLPTKVGSNAVIIGPTKSKSGNPIMFGGPQVGLTAPGFIYEVGLHGPNIDIQGSSFIGYPFIMFGATQDFSMGATAGYGDVVDIFEEKLNPNNPSQYMFKGEWRNFEKQTEIIEVKQKDGTTKKVSKEFEYSVHGPVISKDPKSGVAYTKAWTFRGTEADSWAAYLSMNYAKNVDDFAEAARDYTMTLDWFYADKEGNIAFFHTSKSPIRDERVDWRLPTLGTGEYEWKGFRDPKDNPYEINPESGFITGWNNKPSQHWSNNSQNSRWGINNRVHKFIDGINARDLLTFDDVNEINYAASFANLDEKWFKPYLLELLSKQEGSVYKETHSLLEKWNGLNEDVDKDGYYDATAADRILNAWIAQLSKNVIEDDYAQVNKDLLIHILQGEKSNLKPQYEWLKENKSIEKLALVSFDQAMVSLKEKYGDTIEKWTPQPIQKQTFAGESWIGWKYGAGDDTEFIVMNRGSENHFVELTPDGPIGMNVTPPGQIGFISQNGEYSRHYSDQIDLYINFEYKQMLFNKEDVLKNAVNTLTLDFSKISIGEAINKETGNVTVSGYIVGNAKNAKNIALKSNFYNNGNLLIADQPNETDVSKMMLVTLTGENQKSYGLKENPNNLGKLIVIKGERHKEQYGIAQLMKTEVISIEE